MKSIRVGIRAGILCVYCSTALAQYHGNITRGASRRWAEPPEQRSLIQLRSSPNARELRTDADEMAKLAQSVVADVEAATSRGLLAKDLNDKLKRIEKLSKKLRNELGP